MDGSKHIKAEWLELLFVAQKRSVFNNTTYAESERLKILYELEKFKDRLDFLSLKLPIWYHGSKTKFSEFSLDSTRELSKLQQFGNAIYLTNDKSLASAFGPHVYTVLHIGKSVFKESYDGDESIAVKFYIRRLEDIIDGTHNNVNSKECLAVYNLADLLIVETEYISKCSTLQDTHKLTSD